MAEPKPFEQLPFEELPAEPRRPHGYAATEGREIVVETPEFGAVETHYRTCGEGPPLLLVHGLMTSSYAWRYAFPLLEDEHTLYAPDLPGAGRSDKPLDVEYTPRALADWIGMFQRAVGIRGAPAIGNSLGGYLCLWLALRDERALSALLDVHSPGVPTARLRLLQGVSALPGVQRFVAWLARRNPEQWAHEHVHYYDETLKSREEAETYGAPLATRRGSLAFAKYTTETLDTGAMVDLVEQLEQRRSDGREFPVPLWLLYAERDPMVPPGVGEQLAELVPGAELRTLPEVSHFAQVDAPEAFAEQARQFLAAAGGGP